MLIDNHQEQINYLVKMKDKKQKLELERKKEFVKDFNREAKRGNSEWFAEIEPSK